jgi:probable F420-dependent oxidoreductase
VSNAALDRIGRIGLWSALPVNSDLGFVRELAGEVEELGYGALWYPEAIGRESLSVGALLLSWTSTLGIGTSIMNIWARDATAAVSGAKTLESAFPGRFVQGLGVSHSHVAAARGHDYAKPLAAMRAYLDGMDAAPFGAVQPAEETPRMIAALAPRMLELARDRTSGSIPYLVPPEHTAYARERLGPDSCLAVEQAVILTEDSGAGRAQAGAFVAFYLRAENYVNNLKRLGWGDDDLDGDGSDKLADALVAVGEEDAIRRRVQAHFDAGADHVCIQPLISREATSEELGLYRDQVRRLAAALRDL